MTQTDSPRSQADGHHDPLEVCERCGDPVPHTLSVGSRLMRLCQPCTEEVIGEEMRDALR